MSTLRVLSSHEKFERILEKNTFFLNVREFEDKWEAETSSIVDLLLLLKRDLEGKTTEKRKKYLITFVSQRPGGLSALLCLFGISQELLLRLITFLCAVDTPELNRLVNKDKFPSLEPEQWTKELVFRQVRENKAFAEGLVNLFMEGFSIPVLQRSLPIFELKNFTYRKLDFSLEMLVDSIVRYSKKGSYEAEKDAVTLVLKPVLTDEGIPYATGKLNQIPRMLDLIIPDKEKPLIAVQSSYVVTTSSAMGDKAKFEADVAEKLKQFYPQAEFLGFIDGIGWYVRRADLEKMVRAYVDVFTFHPLEIDRFIQIIKTKLAKVGYFKNEKLL